MKRTVQPIFDESPDDPSDEDKDFLPATVNDRQENDRRWNRDKIGQL